LQTPARSSPLFNLDSASAIGESEERDNNVCTQLSFARVCVMCRQRCAAIDLIRITFTFVSRVCVLRLTGGKAEAGADKAGRWCEASMVASIARFAGGIDRENSQRMYILRKIKGDVTHASYRAIVATLSHRRSWSF
jgi:hypothetical protein